MHGSVIPFSPDDVDGAVDQLMASLDPAVRVLALGEPMHGVEVVLRFRNAVIRRLVAAHGFSAIAIESSYPRGRIVDRYVTGGPGTYDDVKEAGFSHGFGAVEANRDLVEWVRSHNAGRGEAVRFYGFDLPGDTGPVGPRETLALAIDALGEAGDLHRQRIDPLLGDDAAWADPMAWRDPARTAELLANLAGLRAAVEDLIAALRTVGPAVDAEAVHCAVLGRGLLTFFQALATGTGFGESLGVRDLVMADNLAHVVGREAGRVFVFAHNGHVQRGRMRWAMGSQSAEWWPAGTYVTAAMGRAYAVVGTAVGESAANGIGPPESGTIEAALTAMPGPARLVPAGALPAAAVVRSGSTRAPGYFPLTPQSSADFDWVAAFDDTAHARGASPLP